MTKLADRIQKLLRNRHESKQQSVRGVSRKRMLLETLERRTLMAGDLSNFLTTEHVDLSIVRDGNALALRVLDDTGGADYAPNETLLYAGSPSQTPRPANSSFNFIGVNAGEPFYLLPQGQDVERLFLGVGTESLVPSQYDRYSPLTESKGRISANARWVKTSLVDVRHQNLDGSVGDGAFSMWQTGSFGETQVYIASYNDDVANPNAAGLDFTDGISSDDAIWVTANSHVHYNFGFSKPGRYEVDLRMSTYLGDDGLSTPNTAGLIESQVTTVYFSVSGVGQFEFDPSSYSVDEGAGVASIDVVRVGGSDGRILVNYLTAGGTATSGSDFSSTSGALEFLDGETVKTITIPIVDDSGIEASETFTVGLSSALPINIDDYLREVEGDANGLLRSITTASVTILDNDAISNSSPTISAIADQFLVVGNSLGPIAFTVGDVETPAGDLVVTATSSNQTVIPNGNIVLGGSGANRTITISSVPNQVRPTTITVVVTDAGGAQASDTFVLTVGDLVRATFDRSSVITNAAQPLDVHLADIDNDGDLDLLFVEYVANISFTRNNGDGTFGAVTKLPALTISDFKLTDVDGDDLPDIVSSVYVDTTYAETAIAIWRNLGGSFSGQEIIASTRVTGFVGLTGVGDVDGDGLNDLVVSNDGLGWSRNLGGGSFGPIVTISTGGINYSSTLNDVDQDGDLDVVQATYRNDAFALDIFRNSGGASPSFAGDQIAFGASPIRNIAIGDTNQDGFTDIHLIRSGATREIVALNGTSTGVFSAPIVLGSGPDLTDLKIGDIDGDGRADLALTAREQNKVQFAQNLGGGIFTALQEFTHDGSSINPYPEAVAIGDIDRDGRKDLVYSERFGNSIAWSRNRSEEDITALAPPASRTYLNGYPMTFDVFLGFNAKLNTSGGSPTLPVTIGSQTIQVPFVGQPNANTLRFRYQVQSTDVDLDGIQVANSVVLNGATITDIHDRSLEPALLDFASVDTTGVLVNGGAPYVTGIMRLDPTPANTSSVRYEVTLSEPVSGVGMDDFTLDANGPTGATITSVTGSGNSYVVTANIGTGDGTLKLRVLDDDSIIDVDSNPLGGVGLNNGEFAFGQGYTIRSSTATPVFNNILTDGHMDLSLLLYEGTWYPYWNGAGFWDTSDTLLSAGPDARSTRPADPIWDFLGADADGTVWIFPETYSTTTPWPGVAGYDNAVGLFASYFESDPRVNATADWIEMQLLDVRGPEGGEFSLYQTGIDDPVVFMASSDGIGADDTAWIQNLAHVHYNWAFSKPGLYQIDVVASGYVDFNQNGTYEAGIDPLSESQIITLHFGVEVKPTISEISNLAIFEGSDSGQIPFTVNDDANVDELVITATSSNQELVPNSSIVLEGSGINRTILLTPSQAQIGTTTITVTVTDQAGFSTSETFLLTVNSNSVGVVPFAYPAQLNQSFQGPISVTFGDFDGDADLDLAASGTDDGVLRWYRNDGGVFNASTVIDISITGIYGLNAADIDGDGIAELFASSYAEGKELVVYRTNGSAFGAAHVISNAAGTSGTYPHVADMNGDGKLDVVVFGFGPDIRWFAGDGLGAFAAETIVPGVSSQSYGQVGDIDNDGDVDLIYASYEVGKIYWRFNDGAGIFSEPMELTGGPGLSADGLADVNGDGYLDIIGNEWFTGKVSVYPNLKNGQFGAGDEVVGVPGSISDIKTGDVDRDGDLDLVIGTFPYGDQPQLVWLANSGQGTFGSSIPMAKVSAQVGRVAVGDLDSDGDLDFAYTGYDGHRVDVLMNRLGQSATTVVAPQAGTYLVGQAIDVTVHIGYPTSVTGVPSVGLQIGTNVRQALYLIGAGTTELVFRYVVTQDDVDLDGIEIAGSSISLNGGAILDAFGNTPHIALPASAFSQVIVNGSLPILSSIARSVPLAPNPTNASTVTFQVTFNKPVSGVDATDFEVATTGSLSDVTIASVTGTGATYNVVVNTGTGSGVIGLKVNNDGTIIDDNGGTLSRATADAQVFTLRRHSATVNQAVYPDGHGDVGVYFDGERLGVNVTDDGFFGRRPETEYDTEEVLIYGKAGYYRDAEGNAQYTALLPRPTGSQWDFLGGSEASVYLWPNDFTNFDVPYLGTDAGSIPAGSFAKYDHEDPRLRDSLPG